MKIFLFIFFVLLVTFLPGEALDEADLGIVSNFIREDVQKWKEPAHLRDSYVYYWSGYDDDRRPLWILELGKWNIKKIAVLAQNETTAEFDMYVDKAILNILNSMEWNTTNTEAPTQVSGIVDMEGFKYIQLASGPTVEYILRKFQYLVPVMYRFVHHAYLINTNAYAEVLIQMLRPILGSVMERVEVFGTNKSKWKPRLLKTLPKDQLPPWYGGSESFAPVKAYGR